MSTENHPVKKAADCVGGQSALAKALGVTPGNVYQWINDIRQVPFERCPEIEQLCAGAVTCEDLRPDLADQWAYLRNSRKQEAA